MTYEEALKSVKVSPVKSGWMRIRLDYNTHLLLPFKEGISMLSHLTSAEVQIDAYGKNPSIEPLSKDHLGVSFLSEQEYLDIKMANLLGLPVSELAQMREESKNQE